MPVMTVIVPETQESILRPVCFTMVEQVKNITGISSSLQVFFPGSAEGVVRPGAAMGEENANKTVTDQTANIFIEVEEKYINTDQTTSQVTKAEHCPIFRDDYLGIIIKPAYTHNEVRIDFKYTSKDESVARRWQDDLRQRLSLMREIHLHTLQYHYLFPERILSALGEIHALRENVDGYGDTYTQYLQAHSTKSLTRLSNRAGTQTALGIRQTQTRVIGSFEFSPFPEKPEKQPDGDMWVASFTYVFQYDKITHLVMKYPIMVHNQVIPPHLRSQAGTTRREDRVHSARASLTALSYFELPEVYLCYNSGSTNLFLPEYDEFTITATIPEYHPIFTALCSFDEHDPNTLLSLRELGDLELNSRLLEILEAGEYQYLCRPYESVMQFIVFIGESMLDQRDYGFTKDLKVYLKADPNKRLVHHVRFSLLADLSLLSEDAKKRLENNPDLWDIIKGDIKNVIKDNPSNKPRPAWPNIEEGDSIFGKRYKRKTALQFGIIAHRAQQGTTDVNSELQT